MAEESKKKEEKKAPPPENKILAFMKEAMSVPEYKQMLDYLMSRRSVPEMRKEDLRAEYGAGTYGAYEVNAWGNELPPAGRIRLGSGSGTDTLIHEVVHAVDRAISTQYESDPNRASASALLNQLFGEATQFVDAYEKLKYNSATQTRQGEQQYGDQRTRMSSKIDPEWTKARSDYRATPKELAARGIENMVARGGATFNQAPEHVDATMATEFMILLDLAQRDQNKKPSSQGR